MVEMAKELIQKTLETVNGTREMNKEIPMMNGEFSSARTKTRSTPSEKVKAKEKAKEKGCRDL